jgi:hypothetical protein
MLIGSIGGPILEAELFPLSGQGRLRVTYHWMYSALNCDPRDESRFVWTLMGFSNGQVALTPRHAFEGRTLFASVRDDWNWYVQVQAPRSAHWITQPLRNERLEIEGQDLLMISLRGFNGQHIAVDAEPSRHGNHAGHRLRSLGAASIQSRMWFLGIERVLQPGLQVTMREQVTDADIRRRLGVAGVAAADDEIRRLTAQVAGR